MRLRNILLIVCLLIAARVSAQTYCTPTYSVGCSVDYFSDFTTTGGIKNLADYTDCPGTYFSYLTGTGDTLEVVRGATISYSFTNTSYKLGYEWWVDYNQNGDYTDAGENVYNSVGNVDGDATVTGSFTVPTDAPFGITRTRVECAGNATSNTDYNYPDEPCGSHKYGLAKDYVFIVVPNKCDTIHSQPISTSICAGGDAMFAINADTLWGGSLNYQWMRNGTPIPGATNATFTMPAPGYTDTSFYYSVLISNPSECPFTEMSDSARLHISPLPSVTLNPAGTVYLCGGEAETIDAMASGDGYQWQMDGSDIPGATNASFTVNAAGHYDVRVTSGICSGYSTADSVVDVASYIPNIIVDGWVLHTDAYASYQWYVDGAAIPGATSQYYTATADGSYYVIVTVDGGCEGQSTEADVIAGLGVATVHNSKGITVYPNPNNGSFNVRSEQALNGNNVTITVTNLVGQVFYSKQEAIGNTGINSTIALPGNVPDGVYLLRVADDSGSYVTSFVVGK